MLGIDITLKYLGLNENRDTKKIEELLESQSRNGDISINPSTTSWCAAWVNFCERSCGNPGTGKLNAQSFLTYGEAVRENNWKRGDIVVFHFSFDKAWQGHVTYLDNWDDNKGIVTCVGGNQDNQVRVSTYSQDNIVEVRRYI